MMSEGRGMGNGEEGSGSGSRKGRMVVSSMIGIDGERGVCRVQTM